MAIKRIVIFLSVAVTSLISCKKDKQDCSTLSYEKAKVLQSSPVTPRTEIWQWEYKDKKYIYVTLPSVCCDNFSSILYDEKCNAVCHPEGGVSGNGDGKCDDLKANAEKKMLWKDTR